MSLSKIKYVLLFLIILSCSSQKEIVGRYENRYSVSIFEKPIFKIRGINTLKYQYNFEFSKDSTYKVYNCLCISEGKFEIRNDSLILINQINKTDSTLICFEKNSYRIKNSGRKLIRRDGSEIERLYRQKN